MAFGKILKNFYAGYPAVCSMKRSFSGATLRGRGREGEERRLTRANRINYFPGGGQVAVEEEKALSYREFNVSAGDLRLRPYVCRRVSVRGSMARRHTMRRGVAPMQLSV